MQPTDQQEATVDVAALRGWLDTFAEEVAANRDLLTRLDSEIGDADHGSNLHRGMTKVIAVLDEQPPATPAALFKTTGMTLVSTVGGASGPLLGTLFLRLSGAVGLDDRVDPAQLASGLRAGLDGIVARGHATAGDKTMYDALAPACDAFEQALGDDLALGEALEAASTAAAAGRDSTVGMLAKKGRASYLGERSVGHQDPGATSTAMLIAAAADALR
ncbi:MAG TPA: dihydroxyacetone kinase subunit DhaL [Nocardioidaceae bacterium]|nr:dihydroxyacetone kinase subunit DhaL [Nocardioidaceae bacterium]